MRKILPFLLFFFFACTSDNAVPKNIIPLDSMKLIMWDMILAEEFSMNKIPGDTVKKDATPAFQQVFKIHHTTKDAFYKSLRFYESHANLNKTLLDSVNAFANRTRQDLYKRIQ